MSTAPPPLAADLNAGLRRLKLAAIRRLAPELLVTARTQRWDPEEFLRTLIEAEITARDESNARTRMRQAAFPVTKTLDEFDLAASTWPLTPCRTVRKDLLDHASDFVCCARYVVAGLDRFGCGHPLVRCPPGARRRSCLLLVHQALTVAL